MRVFFPNLNEIEKKSSKKYFTSNDLKKKGSIYYNSGAFIIEDFEFIYYESKRLIKQRKFVKAFSLLFKFFEKNEKNLKNPLQIFQFCRRFFESSTKICQKLLIRDKIKKEEILLKTFQLSRKILSIWYINLIFTLKENSHNIERLKSFESIHQINDNKQSFSLFNQASSPGKYIDSFYKYIKNDEENNNEDFYQLKNRTEKSRIFF